jgi:glutamine amidotransferase
MALKNSAGSLAIVDYGMGNLRSVQKAFEKLGHPVRIIHDSEQVRQADRLVLPGVGAMADAMSVLRTNNLTEPIVEHIVRGRPFLGICLGLQMLFERSHENGEHSGLGVLQGDVVRFNRDSDLKVPHMGWNYVNWQRRPTCLEAIPDGSQFYFVHSYFVRPVDSSIVAGSTEYGDHFTACVWKENILATQFHPEKSQRVGLNLLDGFARWNP